MIYLDNAATTFPKPRSVIKETTECIKKYCGNPGRSSHKLSVITSEKIYEAREKIANFIGIHDPEKIIFLQNATYALNLAIKTTVEPNTHVLISDMEHNSVLRPIHAISKCRNIEYSTFSSNGDIEKNIKALIRSNTKYLISSLTSNVTGKEIPLPILSKIAKQHDVTLIVDASQALGHIPVDLSKNPCDVLCSAGHKALFGIQGVGFAVFLDEKFRKTLIEGGSGNDSFNPNMPTLLPERFEAGTLSSPAIISLLYGINFIEEIGLPEIRNKISTLEKHYVDILRSFDMITIHGANNGIISFNIKNLDSEYVAELLDNNGICTRGGFHCSPLAHTSLGTTDSGTVRLSLSYMNKFSECDRFYKALKYILK